MQAHDYFTLRLVRLKTAEDWSFKRDGLCLLFPTRGEGSYVTAAANQRLVAGDVLLIGQSIGGQLLVKKGAELVFWCFALRLDHLYPLFAGIEISQLETMASAFNSPRHFPAALPLARQCHQLIVEAPPQFNLDHRSQLLRVASIILNREFKSSYERRIGAVSGETHLMEIFEQLTAEELLTISVGDLAARFSCSRRHLNRLFHLHLGFSVAGLRMEMRLLKAVSLLRDAKIKVINVAEQCGFNHLGLFNTCFKRRFGMSPGQWRKQMSEPEPIRTETSETPQPCPLHSKGLCPMSGVLSRASSPPLPAASVQNQAPNSKVKLLINFPAAVNPVAMISPNHPGTSVNGHP